MNNHGTMHGISQEHIAALFRGKVCEEVGCGARAEYLCNDYAEAEPVEGTDAQGNPCLYAAWLEPETHYYCAAHKRPPRHTLRNGKVVEGTMV